MDCERGVVLRSLRKSWGSHRLKNKLTETVNAYQAACRNGTDEKFGRSKETLVEFHGKHYGVPLWPCLLNTQGGPKRNVRGQIVDVWGKPIKRLYGVGEAGLHLGIMIREWRELGGRAFLGLGRMVGLNAAGELPLR